MKKRILSIVLALCLVFSLLPVSALADTTASGKCGDNVTWTLDDSGTLTISGTGAMNSYSGSTNIDGDYVTTAPWRDHYKSIKSVVIEDGVTSIGNYAFLGCSSLTSVTIPDSVTSIGESAFRGCSSLTNVTIPNSVTNIGDVAFYKCSSLTSITIPDSVTSIGGSAFNGCSSLTSVTIGNSVTSIGGRAFYDCSSLTSVTIGNSVTSIGDYAFYDCSSLKDVYYTGDVSSWLDISFGKSDSNPCRSGANLYFNGELVTDVVIPNSVTSVGAYAFYKCSSLTSITIPDSVTSIGGSAFEYCSSLTSVTIGNSVTSIGSYAFYNCSSLTSVTIPDSVTSIGWCAFEDCISLTSVTIPDSVTSIGDYAFRWCNNLKDVYYTGDLSSWLDISFGGLDSNPCRSGANLYFNGELATDVVIPDGVTNIGYAFSGCSSLINITIPDSVTSIGSSAFKGCSSLTSVTIPDSVTSIGDWAFDDCSRLTSVTIPDSVTSIGSYAFEDCIRLTSVTIPDSVTSIGEDAFRWCNNLKDVAFGGTKDVWQSIGYTFSVSVRMHYNCTSLEGHLVPIEVKEPSCTSTGYIKYICDCGYEFTETVPQNHNYIFSKTVAPTCGEHGYDLMVCSKCGREKKEYKDDQLLEHSYQITVVEPTCSSKGYTLHKCTVCGSSYKDTYVDEVHDYQEIIIEPTCLTGGYTLHKCSICGNSYKDELVQPLGHSEVSAEAKAPTCTEAGHTAGTCCSRCGKAMSGMAEIAALGHSFGDWTQTKAPTCTASGTEIRTCTRCNATETREIAATVHHYTEKVTAPTCTAKGYTTHTCACGDSYVDSYTDALGHSFGTWTQIKAPTCTASGTEIRTCTRCNATETREIAATVHHYTEKVTAPTCTAKGYTTHTCVCGDSYVDSYTEALGHSYKNGVCTRCGAKDPNYIAAPTLKITTSAGHPKLSWNAVPGAAKYWIYRSTDGKNFKYYDKTTKTSYTNSSTTIGTTYYYKVKAVKTVNGKDIASDYSVVKSIKCAPAAPTVSISRSGGKAKLSWKAVSGATKYWVYRSTDGKKYTRVISTTKLSYTDSKSKSGTKYYYKVMAVAVVNETNVGSACSAVKSITTTLAKPTVKITTASGKPKLTWGKVTGADKYYVYRSTDGKTFKHFATTTKLSYTNTSAKKGTKYYYKVKAVYSANTNANSAYSAVVSIKATK